jgi:hypothetical protein
MLPGRWPVWAQVSYDHCNRSRVYGTQDSESGFGLIFGVYTVMYFFMAFSLLLNFFLAIVIDSYATVQDMVKLCQIENAIVKDVLRAGRDGR